MPRTLTLTSAILTSGLLAAATTLSAVAAQTATPKPAASTPSAVKPPVAPPGTLPNADIVGFRLPLLREGSVISRVVGDITLDPDERHWVFRPIQPESGNLRREFVLLPSPTLGDMLRTRKLSPSPVEYELTGRVFIYKGRNYLFAELAPPIVRFDARLDQTPNPNAKPQPTPNGQSKFVPPATKPSRPDPTIGKDDDATVDDIERRLEQRVGRTPVGKLSGGATSDDAKNTREKSDSNAVLPEPGTRLVLRAGRLMRDPQAGSWRFVPEQVTGKGDVSMEILPCLLLEKLELLSRESDSPPGILLSGSVVVFDGSAYLLPTSFRRAREGRGVGR